MHKKLPIGLADFRRIIEEGYYYVDKSLLIKELLDSGSQVVLLPRPRRFGKTLNLSMLRYFFEKTEVNTSALFKHLAIWKMGEAYTRHQGAYPVITVSFKDVKCTCWDECFGKLKEVVTEEYRRHDNLLSGGVLKAYEAREFLEIVEGVASKNAYESSLKRLSAYLERQYGKRAYILIDEYDTPLHGGYMHGYYSEVVSFMRSLFSAAFKDNPCLEQGVLTGILRLAKENLFSGLNNLQVCSLLDRKYNACFGLLEDEVRKLLADYAIDQEIDQIRSWYNGYIFGDAVIYNPWSILNFVDFWPADPRPYWVNTSDNALIHQLLTRHGAAIHGEMEQLLRRESIWKPIDDHVALGDLDGQPGALWSLLLFSGYLKSLAARMRDKTLECQLQIPNLEVEHVYEKTVRDWLQANITLDEHQSLLRAFLAADIPAFTEYFRRIIIVAFSYLDTAGAEPELAYHAFTLGLLISLRDTHEVRSNRESGFGRYDIMVIPKDKKNNGFIIEFKKADHSDSESLTAAAGAALRQIEEKMYAAELHDRGVRNIVKMGIAFCGKETAVASDH